MQPTSWPMISGRSGFPKLRLSVSANGLGPTAERFTQASATACLPSSDLNAADQLAHDLRPLRISEIEIVGERQRLGADSGEITPGFGHRLLAAFRSECSRPVGP